MRLQTLFWYNQGRLEKAKSAVLRAAGVYEKIGATKDVGECSAILHDIEREKEKPVTSGAPDYNGELLKRT